VNGIDPTLKALQRGQVRTLLADGQDDDFRIDNAVEEALAQRVQVDVVYDERARRGGGRARRPAAVPSLMPGSKRPIRVLVAKPGLDGHDRGAKVVAAALRDAGMEVIYTGLHQTPEMIAQAAIQEDVDVVGLSILSGAHLTLFPRVKQLPRRRRTGRRAGNGRWIIPPEDIATLRQQGIGRLFGPGTPTADLVKYIEEWAAVSLEPS